jgi:hypothetical protein
LRLPWPHGGAEIARAQGLQMGRLPPGGFSSRYLPVGIQAVRIDIKAGDGPTWWLAAVRLKLGNGLLKSHNGI